MQNLCAALLLKGRKMTNIIKTKNRDVLLDSSKCCDKMWRKYCLNRKYQKRYIVLIVEINSFGQ